MNKVSTEFSPIYQSVGGESPTWSVYNGDSKTTMLKFEPASVDCVITSPPYFWQRDYGVDGQIGMEPTIDGFVENIVEVFKGIRHVLKPSGTVFLNLGDTYYSAKGKPHGKDDKHKGRNHARNVLRAVDGPGLGLPRKSLIGIPWRTALALASDGWTLRSDIIWLRRTTMPEPTAKDRPWRHHEHIFMFSRSPKYYFDRKGLQGEEDVWLIEPDRSNLTRGQHYAPFPTQLVRRCIEIGCPVGGTILDPFAGGGTTLRAAVDMGRNAIGVELNSEFCSVIAGSMNRQQRQLINRYEVI